MKTKETGPGHRMRRMCRSPCPQRSRQLCLAATIPQPSRSLWVRSTNPHFLQTHHLYQIAIRPCADQIDPKLQTVPENHTIGSPANPHPSLSQVIYRLTAPHPSRHENHDPSQQMSWQRQRQLVAIYRGHQDTTRRNHLPHQMRCNEVELPVTERLTASIWLPAILLRSYLVFETRITNEKLCKQHGGTLLTSCLPISDFHLSSNWVNQSVPMSKPNGCQLLRRRRYTERRPKSSTLQLPATSTCITTTSTHKSYWFRRCYRQNTTRLIRKRARKSKYRHHLVGRCRKTCSHGTQTRA